MYRKQLLALAGLAGIGGMLLSAPASAATVTVGLQEAGVNSGAITNEGSSFNGSYGTFTANISNGLGQSTPTNLLSAQSLNVSGSTAGVLNVFVTVSDLTSPLGLLNFMSSFTENVLDPGLSVQMTTYLSSANALFTGVELNGRGFTSIGTAILSNSGDTGTGPYSITANFMIVSDSSVGTASSTIAVSSTTPLPGTLPLFAGGLGLVGMLVRRRKQKGVVARSAIA